MESIRELKEKIIPILQQYGIKKAAKEVCAERRSFLRQAPGPPN